MASDPSTAELKLIDGVELKLALASDTQFVKLIGIYLCPLLLKLASPHTRTRAKTKNLLAMVDNRISSIVFELPIEALLTQYKDAKVPELVKDTTIQYLHKSLINGQIELGTLPLLMSGFAQVSSSQQSILFNIICHTLMAWVSPESTVQEDQLVQIYRIDSIADQEQLSKRFLDIMFLNMGYFKQDQSSSIQSTSSQLIRALNPSEIEAAEARRSDLHKLSMSGLQVEEIIFLTPWGASTFTIASLNAIKLGILRYLTMPIMTTELRHAVALVASFDLKNEIQNTAGTVIRQCELTDSDLYAQTLFNLLLERRNLGQQLHIRALQLLSKSVAAVKREENALAVIASGIECISPSTSYVSVSLQVIADRPKIRSATIGFLQWYARFGPSSGDSKTTPKLLSQITRFLNSQDITDDAKGSAYVAMGYLVRMCLFLQIVIDNVV